MEAAQVVQPTIKKWIKLGLLPRPTRICLGYGFGTIHRFTAETIEQARWITEQRKAGYNLKEIRAMLDAGDGRLVNEDADMARVGEPLFATAAELMLAADVSRATIVLWTRAGLLPQPTRVLQGRQGNFMRYPRGAIEIAGFIAKQRAQGKSLPNILKMLQDGLGPPMS